MIRGRVDSFSWREVLSDYVQVQSVSGSESGGARIAAPPAG